MSPGLCRGERHADTRAPVRGAAAPRPRPEGRAGRGPCLCPAERGGVPSSGLLGASSGAVSPHVELLSEVGGGGSGWQSVTSHSRAWEELVDRDTGVVFQGGAGTRGRAGRDVGARTCARERPRGLTASAFVLSKLKGQGMGTLLSFTFSELKT